MTLLLFLILIYSSVQGRKLFSHNLLSASVLANNTGPGFGFQYERLSTSDKLSVVVAQNFCFSYVSAYGTSPGGYIGGEDQRPMMVFVSPGFRFYPTRSSGTVRYAIGGQFIMGFGKGASNEYISGTNRLKSRSISGITLSNSLHFHMSKYVRAGIAVSLGICADNGVNSAAGANKVNPFGQICFSLGGRF